MKTQNTNNKARVDATLEQARELLRSVRLRVRAIDAELNDLNRKAHFLHLQINGENDEVNEDVDAASNASADAFGIAVNQMFQRNRREVVVQARWAAWSILTEKGYTPSTIARAYKLDRTSVLHGLKRIKDLRFNRIAASKMRSLEKAGYNVRW
jgi:chromosomal replication initiation ATPase DnaA